jgi:alpha-mannosidase
VLEHELPGIRIETTIRAIEGLDRLELTSIVENEAEDHRLRVLIRSDSIAEGVRAESQFAVVHRPLRPPLPRADWVEPPVPTAHTLGAVALGSLVLLTKGQDYRTDFLRGDPFDPPLELGGDVVFSCLKPAEDGSGLVLRVFNPNPQPESLSLSLPARRIRLDEEKDLDGGLELAPGEIATLLLTK